MNAMLTEICDHNICGSAETGQLANETDQMSFRYSLGGLVGLVLHLF